MKSAFATAAIVLASCSSTFAADNAASVVPKFTHMIPNIPGKTLTAVEVTLPPGGRSAPHHHAGSAFIFAYVLSGAVKSQVEGQPAHIYSEGESWYEDPGAHHLLAENMSKAKPVKFLAVFVVDSNDKTLTRADSAK